jgi:hypothetical protein
VTATILLCLLTVGVSAHAECAWVLWHASSTAVAPTPGATEDRNEWAPERGFPEAARCERARQDLIAAALNAPEGVRAVRTQNGNGVNRSTTLSSGPMVARVLEWLCLPDTVDPRGPRGK